MLRWLLFGTVGVYAICAMGVFIRNIGDERFKHYDYYYQQAAIDALSWPLRVPHALSVAWQNLEREW